MNKFPVEIGSIVTSKAGRDEGRLFIVVQEIDADFVMVANGQLRRRLQALFVGIADEGVKSLRGEHAQPAGGRIVRIRAAEVGRPGTQRAVSQHFQRSYAEHIRTASRRSPSSAREKSHI